MKFLSRCRFDFPTRLKLRIYHAVFQSHINYCHLVWGTTSQTNLNRLLVLQKKAVRHVAGVSYRAHTREFFVKYNIIRLTTTFEHRLLYHFRFSPPASNEFFISLANLTLKDKAVCTRSTDKYTVPRVRTNYGNQTLQFFLQTILNTYETANSHVLILDT